MNSSSSLTNSSSFVLFVCGSPRRFLLFCHEKARKFFGEKQKKDEFFSFSLFSFFFSLSCFLFSLSSGQNKNFTLTKAFLPFYDDAERRRQTTQRRQRQRRTEEEEEEESETKEEEEEEDINNNVSKSAS